MPIPEAILRRRKIAAVAASFLVTTGAARAAESAGVELGAVASQAEALSRAFQAPLEGTFRWIAQNQDVASPPAIADLSSYMFKPRALQGVTLSLTARSSGYLRLCMRVELKSRYDTAAVYAAAGRLKATFGTASCESAEGATSSTPATVSLFRDIDMRKVVSAPALPPGVRIGLPATRVVDLNTFSKSQTLVVQNNTSGELGLLNALASDARFSLGSTCQLPLLPGESCYLEIAHVGAITQKTVTRVHLEFSDGSTADFSARAVP